MSSKKTAVKSKNRNLLVALGAFALMALGYYLLNHVATWEEPVFGNTFHIVAGCTLMAVAGIILFLLIKNKYFPKKKRRKKSRPIFLDDVKDLKHNHHRS